MFRIHNYLPLLLVYVLPAICSAQSMVEVFDNPQGFLGKTKKFPMHIDIRSMKRVFLNNYSASDELEQKRVPSNRRRTPELPFLKKMNGFLMTVADVRVDSFNNTQPVEESQTWGDKRLLSKPEVNIYINLELGTLVREQVDGKSIVWVTFVLYELNVGEAGDINKFKKYYVAEIKEIRPVR